MQFPAPCKPFCGKHYNKHHKLLPWQDNFYNSLDIFRYDDYNMPLVCFSVSCGKGVYAGDGCRKGEKCAVAINFTVLGCC
jgi:hypothetical protein